MGNQGRLFKNGLRPVFRSSSNMKWRRIPGELVYKVDKDSSYCFLSWTHKFENIRGPDEEIYFAYTYPWSYAESRIKT